MRHQVNGVGACTGLVQDAVGPQPPQGYAGLVERGAQAESPRSPAGSCRGDRAVKDHVVVEDDAAVRVHVFGAGPETATELGGTSGRQ